MIRVFIGYDRSETVAFHVAAYSVMRRASAPVSITGLVLSQLAFFERERDPLQSTDFAFSRFLVPHLCDFGGMALFMDCDMLCRADIAELFALADPQHAVSVVKHDYTPRAGNKFLDRPQTVYPRKNWSSVMLFNAALCRRLTADYVRAAPALDLHQFRWAEDADIGALPREWNHLVGEYEPNPNAKIAHFTLGTPCFKRFRACEFSEEWFDELNHMLDYDRRNEYSRPERMED